MPWWLILSVGVGLWSTWKVGVLTFFGGIFVLAIMAQALGRLFGR